MLRQPLPLLGATLPPCHVQPPHQHPNVTDEGGGSENINRHITRPGLMNSKLNTSAPPAKAPAFNHPALSPAAAPEPTPHHTHRGGRRRGVTRGLQRWNQVKPTNQSTNTWHLLHTTSNAGANSGPVRRYQYPHRAFPPITPNPNPPRRWCQAVFRRGSSTTAQVHAHKS